MRLAVWIGVLYLIAICGKGHTKAGQTVSSADHKGIYIR